VVLGAEREQTGLTDDEHPLAHAWFGANLGPPVVRDGERPALL